MNGVSGGYFVPVRKSVQKAAESHILQPYGTLRLKNCYILRDDISVSTLSNGTRGVRRHLLMTSVLDQLNRKADSSGTRVCALLIGKF